MRALDTNVLVRVLVDDPSERAEVESARALLRAEKSVLVQEVALAELVRVLRTSYRFARGEIAQALATVIGHQRYVLERPAVAASALTMFSATNADFADCLLLAGAAERKCDLVTFDSKLARLAGALSVVAALRKENP